ncbi:MAG: class I SAM-dependent methyltransferase [Cytophagia bacterium]|nr:MAG: class I SAM-dependent methyltransferase [Cytophagales bacterium]TAG38194.1 MAG: class I SAM-dependent methyltransferase [Cytophagia bacterium]
MLNKFKLKLIRYTFNSHFIGIFINIFYLDRAEVYKSLRKNAHYAKGRLLDVGCSNKPYQNLFDVDQYIGLEIDTLENRKNKEADFFYDGNNFPFDPESFETVLTSQVLEHVFNPKDFLININRVLVSGGYLLLTVPFLGDEHEKPYDFGRYTSFGLKHLIECHGFEVVNYQKTTVGFSSIMQLIINYLNKYIAKTPKFIGWPCQIIIASFFNPIALIIGFLLPKNEDFFLGSTLVAQKVKTVLIND